MLSKLLRGPEPGKSGLEKVAFLFELDFFYFKIEKKKILAQIEKPLFLAQIYQTKHFVDGQNILSNPEGRSTSFRNGVVCKRQFLFL